LADTVNDSAAKSRAQELDFPLPARFGRVFEAR
jgi:hypothetical protein